MSDTDKICSKFAIRANQIIHSGRVFSSVKVCWGAIQIVRDTLGRRTGPGVRESVNNVSRDIFGPFLTLIS